MVFEKKKPMHRSNRNNAHAMQCESRNCEH
jgi:hypothetical protein